MFGLFSQSAQTGPCCEVHDLKQAIESHDLTLVDVREAYEYAQGHVPGALHIPLGDMERRVGEIDATRPLYLMCQTGARSRLAQKKLHAQGLPDAINVNGGFNVWRSAGFPVEAARRAC